MSSRNLGLCPTGQSETTSRSHFASRIDQPLSARRGPGNCSTRWDSRTTSFTRDVPTNSPLLLFDEPFGALDPVTRHEMQEQFLQLRSNYKFVSVFVTHDLLEALAL